MGCTRDPNMAHLHSTSSLTCTEWDNIHILKVMTLDMIDIVSRVLTGPEKIQHMIDMCIAFSYSSSTSSTNVIEIGNSACSKV